MRVQGPRNIWSKPRSQNTSAFMELPPLTWRFFANKRRSTRFARSLSGSRSSGEITRKSIWKLEGCFDPRRSIVRSSLSMSLTTVSWHEKSWVLGVGVVWAVGSSSFFFIKHEHPVRENAHKRGHPQPIRDQPAAHHGVHLPITVISWIESEQANEWSFAPWVVSNRHQLFVLISAFAYDFYNALRTPFLVFPIICSRRKSSLSVLK